MLDEPSVEQVRNPLRLPPFNPKCGMCVVRVDPPDGGLGQIDLTRNLFYRLPWQVIGWKVGYSNEKKWFESLIVGYQGDVGVWFVKPQCYVLGWVPNNFQKVYLLPHRFESRFEAAWTGFLIGWPTVKLRGPLHRLEGIISSLASDFLLNRFGRFESWQLFRFDPTLAEIERFVAGGVTPDQIYRERKS